MQEIFELQWKLNEYTLRNIGIQYQMTMEDPELQAAWIENYRKAFSAELAELIREAKEYGIGTENGKIEVVDMLHFLVSLSHLVGVTPSQIPQKPLRGLSFDAGATRTFLALDDLQNSLKWKWWAKGGGYHPEKAKKAVLELWRCFYLFCLLYGMDDAAVKEIYMAKNQVNFRRQNEDYNEDTKTESDNQAIITMISEKASTGDRG